MKRKTKRIQIDLETETINKLLKQAEKEKRKLKNFIEKKLHEMGTQMEINDT